MIAWGGERERDVGVAGEGRVGCEVWGWLFDPSWQFDSDLIGLLLYLLPVTRQYIPVPVEQDVCSSQWSCRAGNDLMAHLITTQRQSHRAGWRG